MILEAHKVVGGRTMLVGPIAWRAVEGKLRMLGELAMLMGVLTAWSS